jgi:hypothetical protein
MRVLVPPTLWYCLTGRDRNNPPTEKMGSIQSQIPAIKNSLTLSVRPSWWTAHTCNAGPNTVPMRGVGMTGWWCFLIHESYCHLWRMLSPFLPRCWPAMYEDHEGSLKALVHSAEEKTPMNVEGHFGDSWLMQTTDSNSCTMEGPKCTPCPRIKYPACDSCIWGSLLWCTLCSSGVEHHQLMVAHSHGCASVETLGQTVCGMGERGQRKSRDCKWQGKYRLDWRSGWARKAFTLCLLLIALLSIPLASICRFMMALAMQLSANHCCHRVSPMVCP